MVFTDEETEIQKKLINWFKTIWLEIGRIRTRIQGPFSSCSTYFHLNFHFTSELHGTEKKFQNSAQLKILILSH